MSAEIQAIDVHGHYGPYVRGESEHLDRWMSIDASEVAARAKAANTRLTIVSPLSGLLPRGQADAVSAYPTSRPAVRIRRFAGE